MKINKDILKNIKLINILIPVLIVIVCSIIYVSNTVSQIENKDYKYGKDYSILEFNITNDLKIEDIESKFNENLIIKNVNHNINLKVNELERGKYEVTTFLDDKQVDKFEYVYDFNVNVDISDFTVDYNTSLDKYSDFAKYSKIKFIECKDESTIVDTYKLVDYNPEKEGKQTVKVYFSESDKEYSFDVNIRVNAKPKPVATPVTTPTYTTPSTSTSTSLRYVDYSYACEVKGSMQEQILCYTNEVRAKHNLGLLSNANSEITNAAALRSREIISKPSHYRPNGTLFSSVFVNTNPNAYGENIAWGQTSARNVVQTWVSSNAGHYQNITNPKYRYLAVGFTSPYYYVQIFYG